MDGLKPVPFNAASFFWRHSSKGMTHFNAAIDSATRVYTATRGMLGDVSLLNAAGLLGAAIGSARCLARVCRRCGRGWW